MNTEFLLWLLAFFVVTEIFYILFVKIESGKKDSWFTIKIYSSGYAIIFLLMQLMVVIDWSSETFAPFHYDRLIWEAGIIFIAAGFLIINKQIYNKLNEKKKRK